MRTAYLDARLQFLRQTQNSDGGWAYFPGKQSWMEPTAYALLALHGAEGGDHEAVRRGWECLLRWRSPDGSWRPGAQVADPTWVTALGLLVSSSLGKLDSTGPASVAWLLPMSGQESGWMVRLFSAWGLLQTTENFNHRGWPWRPGTSAWIEPTAMTALALQKTLEWRPDSRVRDRLREGQELILSRRGKDGGWNCGNPNSLGIDIGSYPETTGIALLGLQGRKRGELDSALAVGRRYLAHDPSPLAEAWLSIALRCYGEAPVLAKEQPEESPLPSDVLLCALQALAHPAGNWHFLQTGGTT